MTKLLLTLQYLEDLCGHFMPYMMRVLEARLRISRNSDLEIPAVVCLSVLEDINQIFIKKTVTVQKKFTIKLTKAEAIILMKMMLQFPIEENQFWRMNLRNNIVEQLHKQLV